MTNVINRTRAIRSNSLGKHYNHYSKSNNLIQFPNLPTPSTSKDEKIQDLSDSLNSTTNITPSTDFTPTQTKREYNIQSIKDKDKLKQISDNFISRQEYRNNMLFVCGVNLGLRVFDLRGLRFGDFINVDDNNTYTFKDELIIFEHKTRNTRKAPHNRHCPIDYAVKQSIYQYISFLSQNQVELDLGDYMFKSVSSNNLHKNYITLQQKTNPDYPQDAHNDYPMTRQAISDVIKKACKEVGLEGNYATHSFRKTFGYFFVQENKDDPFAVNKLQQVFGHSSPLTTMRYCGITQQDIAESINNMNLCL